MINKIIVYEFMKTSISEAYSDRYNVGLTANKLLSSFTDTLAVYRNCTSLADPL